MEPSTDAIVQPLLVDTVACEGTVSGALFSLVASELGLAERTSDDDYNSADHDALFCVIKAQDLRDRLTNMSSSSWVTRYLGMPDLCQKGNLAKMLSRCASITDLVDQQFLPQTWHLPEQHDIVLGMLQKAEKGRTTYIVKPKDGCQGAGIFLVQNVHDLTSNMAGKPSRDAVIQKYIEPLLCDGFKFDFRVYVCLIGGSSNAPPMTFLCREGLARFCSERYEEPSSTNLHQSMAHLTNYSLNKDNQKFQRCSACPDDIFDIGNVSSKRPLTVALQQLEKQQDAFDREEFYRALADVVRNTVAAMSPVLLASSRECTGKGDIRSMQILGFDVMLDKDVRLHLIEVNNSPSLRTDEVICAEMEELQSLSLAQVTVVGAGTAAVNACFTEGCLHASYCTRSFYTTDRRHGLHCAKAVCGCPPGWYITDDNDRGLYYNPGTDASLVPEHGWTVYTEACSSPGRYPPPSVRFTASGQSLGKLCLCSHSEVPHYHHESPIDMAVKRVVVKGAFELLGQLRLGSKIPSVESYVFVDVAQASCYTVLRRVEAIFHHLGGAEEVFKVDVLKVALSSVCAHTPLEWHDIHAWTQRLNSTDLISCEGSKAMRVYDFLALLVHVGIAAFPGTKISEALSQLLSIMEPIY